MLLYHAPVFGISCYRDDLSYMYIALDEGFKPVLVEIENKIPCPKKDDY